MKLIRFDSSLQSQKALNKPTISIGRNSADFRFSKAAFNLIEGTKVSFEQDEENPENWYIVSDPENGFNMRMATGKTDNGYHFRCAKLRQKIFNSLKLSITYSWKFPISVIPEEVNGKKYFPIITKAAQNTSVTR